MGQLVTKAAKPFVFPAPKPAVRLSDFLDPCPRAHPNKRPDSNHKKKMVEEAVVKLQNEGYNVKNTTAVVDFASSRLNVMVEQSPCLTASRGADGGHWLVRHGRQMSRDEMLRVQGFDPYLVQTHGIGDRKFGAAIGNAMTQTVVEELLRNLLASVGFEVPGAV